MTVKGLQDFLGSTSSIYGRGEPRARKPRVPAPPYRVPGQSGAQIVVLEQGALAGSLPIPPTELDQTAVVAQNCGETGLQLAQRTIQRIAVLERSGAYVRQVSVFLAPDCDDQTMAARQLLGAAVLAHASASRRPCELVFVSRWQDSELRRHLWELVELLVTEPGGAKAPIRLRFDKALRSESTEASTPTVAECAG